MAHIHSIQPSVSSKGFSLLELLLVLFIMGLMTATTMLMTGGVEDQAKYDETKRRMELIKRAIVGDPTRTVNGGPEISGFVADMGRLPGCMSELITPGVEKTPNTDPKTYDSPCGGSPAQVITAWHEDTTSNLWGGWRGPYISTISDSDGVSRFRDGWNNNFNASNPTSDAKNYGWVWDDASVSGVLSLQSWSADLAATTADDFPQPVSGVVPALVVEDDYLANDTMTIRLFNESAMSAVAVPGIEVKLDYISNGVASSGVATLTPATSSVNPNVTLDIPFTMPVATQKMGIKRLQVVCTADGKLFDGQCGRAVNPVASPQFITMPPRTQLPTIRWSIAP